MIKRRVHNIAIADVAPEGEISEAKHDHMVWIVEVKWKHVTIDIATAPDDAAARLKA